ncbi:hypothetical protein AAK27_41 [Mycoplasma capricolum subsp. capricolum]|nr:hypothetical protein AAK27_41 [Mycoplasma capricolum subsp. capricolum]
MLIFFNGVLLSYLSNFSYTSLRVVVFLSLVYILSILKNNNVSF